MPADLRPWIRLALVTVVLTGLASRVDAQSTARFSLDTAVSADLFRGQGTVDRPNIIVDITAVVRLSDGWSFYIRPWFMQQQRPEWDKQIYQAAMLYTRPGPIATRVELGYIGSQVGLGMLDMRPDINPTIGPHLTYFVPMPAFEAGTPSVPALAATYPLGGILTLSTSTWDTRVAVVSSTPVRNFRIGKEFNPKNAPTIEAGAGITPRAGLRVGVSFARGNYATADEVALPSSGSRSVTMIGVEGDYAFAHTKLAGEVMHDTFETAGDSKGAYAWFIQGTQTLAPRWFVAARQEGASAPTAIFGSFKGTQPTMHNSEATVGYRLTTDFTLRASFTARKSYYVTDWDQQAGISVVWAKKWW